MKNLPTILTTMTLVAGLSLAPALIRAPAYAVDNMSSTDAPDLTSVRAKIKAKDYTAALAEQLARLHLAQDRRLKNLADLLRQGAGTAAGPQGGPRVPRRALCRNRQSGEGQGTACHPRETLPQRLRRARGPAEGNQRQISEQVKARATDDRSGRPLVRFYFPAREPIGAIDGQGARDAKPYG